MASWIYTYKTSDGLRHEGVMEAATKDAVYVELRKQGIRAIRVTERIVPIVKRGFGGLRKRDWAIVFIIAMAIIVFGFMAIRSGGNVIFQPEQSDLISSSRVISPALRKLEEKVAHAMDEFHVAFSRVDIALAVNYTAIERSADVEDARKEILHGRKVVSNAVYIVRSLFKSDYVHIPEDCQRDRDSAKQLYGSVIGDLESIEEGLDGVDLALNMLTSNRAAWKTVRGEVVWSDSDSARAFSFFSRASRELLVRWRKCGKNDFRENVFFVSPP